MAIKFDLGRDLDLEFSKWDIELAISPGKKIAMKQSRTYRFTFKVKYWICYISVKKNGPVAKKRRTNISIQRLVSNVAMNFEVGCELDLFYTINDSCGVRCRRAVDSPSSCIWYIGSYHKPITGTYNVMGCVVYYVKRIQFIAVCWLYYMGGLKAINKNLEFLPFTYISARERKAFV